MGKGMSHRRPFTLGGPELIVAIDDDAFDELEPRVRNVLSGQDGSIPIRVVRASELRDPNAEADLYYGRYTPATPDCEKVLEYVAAGQVDRFEQDRRTGAVYRGAKLVWPSAPLAVANMSGGATLEAGADAALFFADGLRTRITTIPSILVVISEFTTRAPGPGEVVIPDWSDRARRALGDVPSTRLN